jgi:hypothetical protein
MTPIPLAKMGICQNTSRLLCFMSSYYGGLDLHNLYVLQGTGQLEFIIRHLCSPGMTGSLLKTVIGWFQCNAGVSYCVLANPSLNIPYLEGYWLCSVWTFLASIHGSLAFADNQIQPKQRKGDTYIMDIALASQLTSTKLRRINLCHLFFNALRISDITNASGNRLSPGILDGTPLKRPPSKTTVTIPSSLDSLAQTAPPCERPLGILHIPHRLSQWTTSGNQLRHRWPFLYSPSSDSLYQSFVATLEVSGKVRTRVFTFTSNRTVSVTPPNAVPVDCEERSDG